MADTKISALTAASAAAGANELAINESGTSKKLTVTQIASYLNTIGMPQVLSLGSAYTNATSTGTEVTGLSFNSVVAGTYFVRWMLLYQVPTSTTSIKFGVNPTALTSMSANVYFPSAGVNAATGTMNNAANATTGQIWAYANTNTAATTAPNLGPWIAVTNTNVDHLLVLEALVVTSGTGDIELWCASEVTATAQLSVGSSGVLIRTS